jgi:DNA primase small subunit
LDENSTLIVKKYFKEYYFRFGEKIRAPSEIASREFGYFPFGGAMIRHLSFKDIGAFRAILVREAPAGVYCSNSLYSDPTAETHLKGWRGGGLIFDIDANSLRLPCKKVHDVWLCKGCGKKEFGARPEVCPSCRGNRILELPWTCRECLSGAKKETMKLLEFLEFDFGIPSNSLKVYFSGSAGYHVEAEHSTYETLDSHGRAEIADYITARGLSSSMFNSEKLSPTDPGWRGRFARFIRDLPAEDKLFKSMSFERRLVELISEFSKDQVLKFMDRAVSENAVRIDAMVTTDIHRIFRMPETLNNKTGLVKRDCTENLDSFDPSIDAIAIPGNHGSANVFVEMAPKIELGGNSYGPFRSESLELPIEVAVYLVLKGGAKFPLPVQREEAQKVN